MRDKRVKVTIEIDVISDWLTGPSIQDIASALHRFSTDLAYAGIYKRNEGTFEYQDSVVGNFKITEEN